MAKQPAHKNVFRSKDSVQLGASTVPTPKTSKRSKPAIAAFGVLGGAVSDFTIGGPYTKAKPRKPGNGKTL